MWDLEILDVGPVTAQTTSSYAFVTLLRRGREKSFQVKPNTVLLLILKLTVAMYAARNKKKKAHMTQR